MSPLLAIPVLLTMLSTSPARLTPAEMTPFLRVISASAGAPGRVACRDIDVSIQLKKDGLSPDAKSPVAWAASDSQLKSFLAEGKLVVCGESSGLKAGASIAVFKENGKTVIAVSIKNAAAGGFTLSDALLKIATVK